MFASQGENGLGFGGTLAVVATRELPSAPGRRAGSCPLRRCRTARTAHPLEEEGLSWRRTNVSQIAGKPSPTSCRLRRSRSFRGATSIKREEGSMTMQETAALAAVADVTKGRAAELL